MHNALARKDEIYPLPLVAKYFPSSVEHRFGGLLFSMPLQGQYYFNMLSTLFDCLHRHHVYPTLVILIGYEGFFVSNRLFVFNILNIL